MDPLQANDDKATVPAVMSPPTIRQRNLPRRVQTIAPADRGRQIIS
jgi:hypothetical protein